jgi:hypothetical protein
MPAKKEAKPAAKKSPAKKKPTKRPGQGGGGDSKNASGSGG